MPFELHIRASEDPEEWAPVKKPGGSTLRFTAAEDAQAKALALLKVQPHVPVRVVPIYG